MEWFQIPNYHAGRTEAIRLIIIHATRSGIPGFEDWGATINTFKSPSAQVSSHRLYNTDGRVGGFVADWDTAWHAGYLNPRSLGAENCQPTIDTPFTDAQIVSLATDVKLWCEVHGIPKVRVFNENTPGIIGHEDTAQGKSFGKTDPGPLFPWGPFMELVQEDEVDQQARDDIEALKKGNAMQQGALNQLVEDVAGLKAGMSWIAGALNILKERVDKIAPK